MCAYKLVTVKFKWWGLQSKIEQFIHKVNISIHSVLFLKRLSTSKYNVRVLYVLFIKGTMSYQCLLSDGLCNILNDCNDAHCRCVLLTFGRIPFFCFSLQQEKRIFTNFHRQLFCWIDRWVELTMEDIRRMEDETQKELEEVRLVAGQYYDI